MNRRYGTGTVEAKVEDKKDTTGTGLKKIKLIDNLNISEQ